MLVVGGQLLQLWRNLRAGVFGSRLALRLVLLFVLVAVPAGRAGVRGIGAIPRAAASKAGSTSAWIARSMAGSTSAGARSIIC